MLLARSVLALCSVLSAALAEDSGVLSCAGLSCPTKGDTAPNECRVASSTFTDIGVAPVQAYSEQDAIHGQTAMAPAKGCREPSEKTSNVNAVKSRERGNDRWSDLTAKRIAGPGSIQPYSQQASSSSNCWPVPHRDSDLGFVEYRTRTTDDFSPGPVIDLMKDVTPILTVFYGGVEPEWPNDEEPRVKMTCVRVLDSSTMAGENESGGGAEIVRLPGMGAALTAVIAAETEAHKALEGEASPPNLA
ncbi:hypothetical protein DL769_011693 [Monosporascus sp. CRB-8-3]|nr:hypothetical protein DL769_011693 [Monosporascus sp. CRB-8-3]